METAILVIALTVALCVLPFSAAGSDQDSIPKVSFVITPRLNSTGHFPFTGSYINKNLNADINIFYERNTVGFFLFKSHDLEERHSIINYLQPGVFKKFEVNAQLKFRFFVGYLFAQASGFHDDDSDYYTAVVTYWSPGDKTHFEHTALLFDLTQSKKLANRFMFSYFLGGFKLETFIWHRWVLDAGSPAISAALAVNLPRVKLSDKVFIQTTFSYQGYLTHAKPVYAMRNGTLFSLAIPVGVR